MRYLIAVIAAFLFAAPAQAEWYEASSDHFVIYAEDSESDVRKFAENLERYHAALERVTGRDIVKPSPSNRVTIFVVGGGRDMRKLTGGNRRIAGFYTPRAGGSKAFVQTIRLRDGYPDFSTVILLHEYAHHFLISSSRFAMPLWMSEGAAEFFAAATFNDDGGVLIGRPAQHRAGGLAASSNMKIEDLLDPYADGDRSDLPAGYYGRAWLLYHYLTFTKERAGQLDKYWQQTASGKSSLEAARATFGDLSVLNRELRAYLRKRRMMTYALPPEMISIGAVTIRELPEGEAKMMPVRIRSQRGVNEETAAEVLEDARKIAAKYPNDPGVLTALAEAEYDSQNYDRAIAAADQAIALDPARTNAYTQKGYALFSLAADAEDKDAAYDAAMAPFSALNAMENDHPLPLIYYYRSFGERGLEPVENARAALERAAILAPFDQRLWMQVAVMQAKEGRIEFARQSLRPLSGNPHGGRLSSLASAMLRAMDSAKEGEPFSMSDTLKRVIEENEKSGAQTGGDETGDDASDDDDDADKSASA